jgi:hypothetical protein
MLKAPQKLGWPLMVLYPHPPVVTVTTRKFDAPTLVAAIAAAWDCNFTVSELWDHAKVKEGPLLAAIGSMSKHQLGKALESITGVEFDGYHIERIGDHHHVALWRVYMS